MEYVAPGGGGLTKRGQPCQICGVRVVVRHGTTDSRQPSLALPRPLQGSEGDVPKFVMKDFGLLHADAPESNAVPFGRRISRFCRNVGGHPKQISAIYR